MKNRSFVTLLSILVLAATAGLAHAALVMDFRTGSFTPEGGTIVYNGTASWGTGIPVDAVLISGLTGSFSSLNGGYDLSGTFVGPDANGSAVLAYNTDTIVRLGVAPGSITITGDVSGLGPVTPNGTLLSGTINTFTPILSGSQFAASLAGTDTKNADLLTDIGVPTNTPFNFLGFTLTAQLAPSATTPGLQVGPAISTDIADTAVPIPTSIFLLGSGFLGLIGIGRRFRK